MSTSHHGAIKEPPKSWMAACLLQLDGDTFAFFYLIYITSKCKVCVFWSNRCFQMRWNTHLLTRLRGKYMYFWLYFGTRAVTNWHKTGSKCSTRTEMWYTFYTMYNVNSQRLLAESEVCFDYFSNHLNFVYVLSMPNDYDKIFWSFRTIPLKLHTIFPFQIENHTWVGWLFVVCIVFATITVFKFTFD